MNWQTIVVIAIVAVAAFFMIRGLVRVLSGRNKGCPCGADQCTLADRCQGRPCLPDEEPATPEEDREQ